MRRRTREKKVDVGESDKEGRRNALRKGRSVAGGRQLKDYSLTLGGARARMTPSGFMYNLWGSCDAAAKKFQ